MRGIGGFEHNLQSLRVVDVLEEHYGAFDGLNLVSKHTEIWLCARKMRKSSRWSERFCKPAPSLEASLPIRR
jgi:dGTPase